MHSPSSKSRCAAETEFHSLVRSQATKFVLQFESLKIGQMKKGRKQMEKSLSFSFFATNQFFSLVEQLCNLTRKREIQLRCMPKNGNFKHLTLELAAKRFYGQEGTSIMQWRILFTSNPAEEPQLRFC